MKWLKICALLVLTLSTMRAGTWILGWILAKPARVGARVAAVLSNTGGFAVFVLLLLWNLMPGEPVDMAAVVFGLIVFALYCVIDFYWAPWKSRDRIIRA
jgi:hypothetical protein